MTDLDPLESLYFAALERAPADRSAYLDHNPNSRGHTGVFDFRGRSDSRHLNAHRRPQPDHAEQLTCLVICNCLIELYTATTNPDKAKKCRAQHAMYPDVAPLPRVVM